MAYTYNVTFVVGAVTCSCLLYNEIFMFTFFSVWKLQVGTQLVYFCKITLGLLLLTFQRRSVKTSDPTFQDFKGHRRIPRKIKSWLIWREVRRRMKLNQRIELHQAMLIGYRGWPVIKNYFDICLIVDCLQSKIMARSIRHHIVA